MNYGWSKHMKKNVGKEKNWKINFQLNWNEAHHDQIINTLYTCDQHSLINYMLLQNFLVKLTLQYL